MTFYDLVYTLSLIIIHKLTHLLVDGRCGGPLLVELGAHAPDLVLLALEQRLQLHVDGLALLDVRLRLVEKGLELALDLLQVGALLALAVEVVLGLVEYLCWVYIRISSRLDSGTQQNFRLFQKLHF